MQFLLSVSGDYLPHQCLDRRFSLISRHDPTERVHFNPSVLSHVVQLSGVGSMGSAGLKHDSNRALKE